jgi:uracil-DNA glycosylase
MLNTVLTVKAHSAKSHAEQGWETLTDAVIKKVGSLSQLLQL